MSTTLTYAAIALIVVGLIMLIIGIIIYEIFKKRIDKGTIDPKTNANYKQPGYNYIFFIGGGLFLVGGIILLVVSMSKK